MKKKKSKFGREFDSLRARQGYSVEKVATLSAMSEATLNRRLLRPETFTVGELGRLSKVIAGDFTTLAQLIQNERSYPA